MTMPTRKAPRIYLIRHGQTAWSLSGHHTGRTDIPLTAVGIDQARSLVPLLQGVRFDRVLTSPRARAVQTCVHAGFGEQAEIEPDLAEWDYGRYEGKLSAEIRQEQPDWNIFEHGCPEGETPRQVADRADRLLMRLAEEPATIALFSHGHFGSVLAMRWIGFEIVACEHFWLETASISILGHHPSRPTTRILTRWNLVPQPGG